MTPTPTQPARDRFIICGIPVDGERHWYVFDVLLKTSTPCLTRGEAVDLAACRNGMDRLAETVATRRN